MTDNYDDQAHYGHVNNPIEELRKGGQFKEIDGQLQSFQKGMEELEQAESGTFGGELKMEQLSRAMTYISSAASIIRGELRKLTWDLHIKKRTIYNEIRNRTAVKPVEKVIEAEMLKDKVYLALTKKFNDLSLIADLVDDQAKQVHGKSWLRHQYKKEDNNLYNARRYD